MVRIRTEFSGAERDLAEARRGLDFALSRIHARSRTKPSHSCGALSKSMIGGKRGSAFGTRGALSGHMPASSQLWFALRELHVLQAVTIFVQVVLPPAERGTT